MSLLSCYDFEQVRCVSHKAIFQGSDAVKMSLVVSECRGPSPVLVSEVVSNHGFMSPFPRLS
jgi:hypothetical protein